MTTTVFVNGATLTDAAWFNDVNGIAYNVLGNGTTAPATAATALIGLGGNAAYAPITTGGTSTAYTLTPTPASTGNVTGQRYRVTFHTGAGATPTLAVSGQTAKNLKYKDSTGTKQAITATQVPSGWVCDVEYDGTDWVVQRADVAASGANSDITSLSGAVINTKRATVASAATTADIWTPGNEIDWTGTVTCTGFPSAPQAGASRTLICAGAAPFTAGANMLIDGTTSGNTITLAANDIVVVHAISTTQFRLEIQQYNGKAVVASGGIFAGTAVASTSGTAIDFTGIPSTAKRVTVMLNGVSTNGTTSLIVQIGDAGGVETSGYLSRGGLITSTPAAADSGEITAGFYISGINTATDTFYGSMTIDNINAQDWVATGAFYRKSSGTAATVFCAGSKTLSPGPLDRIRVTSTGGDTFDAGTINIFYE